MLKAISPRLDKVNVCFDSNGGVVMGLSGRSQRGLTVCGSDVMRVFGGRNNRRRLDSKRKALWRDREMLKNNVA